MVFKKKRKDKRRTAPYLFQTTEMLKHWGWCLRNKIQICVVPNWSTTDKWNVEITIIDKVSLDPVDYTGVEALKKMYEYCKYYYDKNKKDEK